METLLYIALILAGVVASLMIVGLFVELLDYIVARVKTRKATATVQPTPPPAQPSKPRPYGARVGNLVQFGEMWIDVSMVDAINFEPEDGCGAEVSMRGVADAWHLSDEDAAALKSYLAKMVSYQEIMGEAELAPEDRHLFYK